MKILYHTVGFDSDLIPLHYRADYMSDLLFHGLRSLLGTDVIDLPKKTHMYTNFTEDSSGLFGKGFTYSKILEDPNLNYELTSLDFRPDLIVLSAHHLIHQNPYPLHQSLEYFKPLGIKTVVVDGHDSTTNYDFAFKYTPYIFKREIPYGEKRFLPISFCIPKEKIIKETTIKEKYIANILPAEGLHENRKTHNYNNEADYYNDYASSYFAFTVKKAGWDCMRHYEIMANACIPIFGDIEACPDNTLTTMPKNMFHIIKDSLNLKQKIFNKDEITSDLLSIDPKNFNKSWLDICHSIRSYTEQFLTTEVMAKYFLERIKE